MSKTKIWCCTKNYFVLKKKVCSCSKKQSGVDKNKSMLHKKVFHVNKVILILQKKCISYRQKQDDDAHKKYFWFKNIIIFTRMARDIFLN